MADEIESNRYYKTPSASEDRGTLLDVEEFDRLVTLLRLLNDVNVTQVDDIEAQEADWLMFKLFNDGVPKSEPRPRATPVLTLTTRE